MRPEKLEGYTCKVQTPDGTMFITINENASGEPVELHIHVGKSGASLQAWADALARVASLGLSLGGFSVGDLLSEISNITSDRKVRIANGSSIRSGPEGVAYAIQRYREVKWAQLRVELNLDDTKHGSIDGEA
jgi:hypothetical protein